MQPASASALALPPVKGWTATASAAWSVPFKGSVPSTSLLMANIEVTQLAL